MTIFVPWTCEFAMYAVSTVNDNYAVIAKMRFSRHLCPANRVINGT